MVVDSDERQYIRHCAAGPSARGWAGLLALALLLAACKTAPSVTPVSGRIEGVSGLNPSINQRPSPLLLRVYELKSPTTFNQADFMALYQADQATLGADLVAREEIMLAPGEIRPYKKSLAPETKFIGVVAAYRDLERATWRTVVPVQNGKAQTLTIKADSLVVSATLAP
jgi:type VI secretion system protein VasD